MSPPSNRRPHQPRLGWAGSLDSSLVTIGVGGGGGKVGDGIAAPVSPVLAKGAGSRTVERRRGGSLSAGAEAAGAESGGDGVCSLGGLASAGSLTGEAGAS